MKSTRTLSLATALVASAINSALADDQARIDATLSRLGSACKNAVAAKFHGVSMADIDVTLAASFQQGIE